MRADIYTAKYHINYWHRGITKRMLQSRCDELGGVSLPGLGCSLVCIFHWMKSRRPTNSQFVDCSFVCHKREENEEP